MCTTIAWKKLIFTVITWSMTEIILGIVGLDDLADYGEFVFHQTLRASSVSIIQIWDKV